MSSKKGIPEQVNHFINEGLGVGSLIYRFSMALLVLIVCITFVVETYDVSKELIRFLLGVDTVITLIFLCDYIVRWWAKRFSLKYPFTIFALIDLVAILPLFLDAHLQFVRVLRLFRILRLLRGLSKTGSVFGEISEYHLRLARIAFTLFCIIFISSGLIYDIEHEHNPEQIRTFFDALYFSVVTLTTVGYGDIVPLSTTGRVTVLFMILSGTLLIPLQLTNLVRYVIERRRRVRVDCKRCGQTRHDNNARYCKVCGEELPKELLAP